MTAAVLKKLLIHVRRLAERAERQRDTNVYAVVSAVWQHLYTYVFVSLLFMSVACVSFVEKAIYCILRLSERLS